MKVIAYTTALWLCIFIAYHAGRRSVKPEYRNPEVLRIMSTYKANNMSLRREFVGIVQPDGTYKLNDRLCPTLTLGAW